MFPKKHGLLWVIEFLLDKRKDCRNHIFGENLTHYSESHAHFNKVGALKILKTPVKLKFHPQNTLEILGK